MKEVKRLLGEVALIVLLSAILGLAANYSLLRKFVKGGLRPGFLSAEKYPDIIFISLDEAEGLFAQQDALFIDSRAREVFKSGHIPGAVSVPLEEMKQGRVGDLFFLLTGKNLVLYCDGGDCESSTALARILSERGVRNIRVMLGGWVEWLKAGLPEAKE